ncbi:XRE family transcriptional regulator [Myxococcus sp. SDU36]|uniref:helix-turn-helix domain-containing protein n=1 Tax=Myxococcus sp. SDU36 TaxID=2831967 RepID=UPI002543F196|nr:XRE family transcriptional regulator [Myxococcus sp. SDU36]WIG94189.1 XRE family transcriptional regulator [Myxococcus sp. SDU36]
MSARREESRLDIGTLATQARLSPDAIERFERGEGGLGIAALGRLARVLGVDSAELVHTSAKESAAFVAPQVLLKQRGSVELERADLDAMAEGLSRARAFAELGMLLGVERLADCFTPKVAPEREAYQEGYRQARKAREFLPERTGPLKSLARLIENRFNTLVLTHSFGNRGVLGASCRTGDARLIVVNAQLQSEAQRRFVLAHELAHQLLDLGPEAVETDVGELQSRRFWFENSPTEKRVNAFAAMLLAPDFAVHEKFGPPSSGAIGTVEARRLVSEAKRHFGLSYSAMTWHLKNLRYFDESMVDILLMTAEVTEVMGFEEDTRFDGLQRRVLEAFQRELISSGRARELLGYSIEDLLGA